jgi:catechol 1,2-dioxygenase
MQRRSFLLNTAMSAVAISASGFLRFDGTRYTGDCETTTDILGPYYRPGSPVRSSLVIAGEKGQRIDLSGIIRHKDCTTPYKNAKIELWHCDSKGVYDNSTPDFKYRGTTFTDEKGRYSFQTIMPVPYDAGGGHIRPAHYHLMISAEGYQPMVTQLYFTGDPNIAKDAYAASPAAKRRILSVQKTKDGTNKVNYDVSLSEKLLAETAVIDKLTGTYLSDADKGKNVELFKKNNLLWMKNEVYGESFDYQGDNTFIYPSMPPGLYATLRFEWPSSGGLKMHMEYIDDDHTKHAESYTKVN